ncbi:MAG: hypothetical protein EA376_14430 [Phycisphaeraceae bacterium]|nr:MAG: hypothetical protein EA376_14430 [Phycisphaeraceae bacterium]
MRLYVLFAIMVALWSAMFPAAEADAQQERRELSARPNQVDGVGAARVRDGNERVLRRASRPAVGMVRTDEAIDIDGRLDEAAWAAAAVIDGFTQVDPVEGAAPTERTEVRLLYDSDYLYIGVRCFDSNPGGIVATQMLRGGSLGADDRVSIALDTFLDRRNGFFFELGAAGGKRDGLIENNRNIRTDWDGVWLGRATVDELGWTAEFAIPFKTLAFDPRTDAWGFNIERVIRRKNEVVRWATPTRASGLRAVSDAGVIEGLEDLRQGLGLSVQPFVSTRFDLDRGSTRLEPGLDVFYRLTPSLSLAVTVNTDFAEAEVDQRRVNLTRFPLFFPEKREFFLQDAGLFSFGGIFRSPLPYFSRRIGIVQGEEKGILAGVRLTGRQDGLGVGLLNVQMDDDDELGSKNLSVGRFTFDVFDESTVGVIFTHGDPGRRGDNTLIGADYNMRRANFIGSTPLEANLWVMGTHTSGESNSDSMTFGGRINIPDDRLSFNLFAAQIGEDFNPALGFVQRRGVREYNGSIRHRWRPGGFLRRVDLSARANVFTDLDDEVDTSEFDLPRLEFENQVGDTLRLAFTTLRDNFDEPFAIRPGVVVAPDDYRFNRFSAQASTSTSRPLAVAAGFEAGNFLSGSRTDYTAGLEWRPSAHFFGSAEYEMNDVGLAEGDFTVHIARARIDFLFTPQLSWSNTVQYDNVSKLMGVNSRLRWEVEPGRDVFVVLNQGLDTDRSFSTETSELTLKVGWMWRF